jgi:hypothetical protein
MEYYVNDYIYDHLQALIKSMETNESMVLYQLNH